MAHVAAWKKDEVKELEQIIESASVIGIVDISGIAARQLQKMRRDLREDVEIRKARNTLIKLALENSDNESFKELAGYVESGSSLALTSLNPYKLYKQFEKGKTSAPAKGGEICPKEVVVPKGDTGFPPGPIVGEMQNVGIPAAIEGGKIVVKKDHVLLNPGDEITPEVAAVLSKLEIEPLEVGLNLFAVYEDGFVYAAKDLAIDEELISSQFSQAFGNAFNLAFNAAVPNGETTELLLSTAFANARNLAVNASIINSVSVPYILSKVYGEMLSLAGQIQADALDEELASLLGSFAAAAAPAKDEASEQEAEVEEEAEEEEPSEEEQLGGLDALFG